MLGWDHLCLWLFVWTLCENPFTFLPQCKQGTLWFQSFLNGFISSKPAFKLPYSTRSRLLCNRNLDFPVAAFMSAVIYKRNTLKGSCWSLRQRNACALQSRHPLLYPFCTVGRQNPVYVRIIWSSQHPFPKEAGWRKHPEHHVFKEANRPNNFQPKCSYSSTARH